MNIHVFGNTQPYIISNTVTLDYIRIPHSIFLRNNLLTILINIKTTTFIFLQIAVNGKECNYDIISPLVHGYLQYGAIKYQYNCIHIHVYTDIMYFLILAHFNVILHYLNVSEKECS